MLCISVTNSGRSKNCTVLEVDLKKNTFERIEVFSQDKFWIVPNDTPVTSPKYKVIQDAKKVYNDFYQGPEKMCFSIEDPNNSIALVAPQVITMPSNDPGRSTSSSSSSTTTNTQVKITKTKTSTKVSKKTANKNDSTTENNNQEVPIRQDPNNVSVAEQIRLGKEAAQRVLDQRSNTSTSTSTTSTQGPKLKSNLLKEKALRLQQEQAYVNQLTGTNGISSSSSSSSNGTTTTTAPVGWSTESRTFGSNITVPSLLRFGYGQGISNTFHNAIESSGVNNGGSNTARAQSQALLLTEIGKYSSNHSTSSNNNNNNSSNQSSNSSTTGDYQDTMEGAESEKDNEGRDEDMDGKTNMTGTSTLSNNSKLKHRTNEIRMLNPNGNGSKEYCFRKEDMVINEPLRLQLYNNTPRFSGHSSRRPPNIGECFVNVTDGKSIWQESIELHIEIITQLVYAKGCELGIMTDRGDYVYWEEVKSSMTDRNAVWEFKDIITVPLAASIATSVYTKEYQKKWKNLISSIAATMKTNFNPNLNGK